MWAIAAFDFGFFANPTGPLIFAGGGVSGAASGFIFETAWVDVGAAAEELTEERDFVVRRTAGVNRGVCVLRV